MDSKMKMNIIFWIATGVLLCTHCGALSMISSTRLMLKLHNQFRSLVARGKYGFSVANMNALQWSNKLQVEASLIAKSCGQFDKEQFGLELDLLGIPLQGINDVIARRNSTLYRMFMSWVIQRRFYDDEYGSCHWEKPCQMYMQLVSAKTEKVGCALNYYCGRHQYFVCLYSPGVAEIDNSLYSIGGVCTHCEAPRSFCVQGLCVPCNPKINNCECKKTCRHKGALNGLLDSDTCTCHCEEGMGPNCDVECRNPDQYLDYDICGDVTELECQDPQVSTLLAEFCPEQCVCGKSQNDFDIGWTP